jgi:pimeloyl-ACP methyl ester carboxylesterase
VVYRLPQHSFEPLVRASVHAKEPLVAHVHAAAPSAERGAILVHGLNGRRYSTWGKFPGLLFEDYPDTDVGLYGYSSGIRFLRRGAMPLRDHATLLAEVIRDEAYARTVLIGHSMGGILCLAAVQKLIEDRLRTKDGRLAIDRIAGVILMAAPLAGSLRAFRPLSWLVTDGMVLRAHSGFVTQIQECCTNKLVIDNGIGNSVPDRHYVPVYAVVGLRDKWVDRYSSGVAIPVNQKKHAAGSHTSVPKPSGREDPVYRWLCGQVVDCFENQAV